MLDHVTNSRLASMVLVYLGHRPLNTTRIHLKVCDHQPVHAPSAMEASHAEPASTEPFGSLCDLPLELLCRILDNLPLSDILNIRRANRTLYLKTAHNVVRAYSDEV